MLKTLLPSLLLCLLLLCLLLLSSAQAEVVPDFYQQNELVADQGTAERRRALARALEKMVVRASGIARLPGSLMNGPAFSNPAAAIEAYRYESTDETIVRGGESLPASRLIINFSKATIEKILRSAGLPIWSSNRPSVLIWLVKDDFALGRQLVTLQDESDVATAVRSAATTRGLPVVLPLLDLEDRLSISAEKLWSLNETAIVEASLRYQSDVLMVGRYSQASSGKWLATWSLGHKEKREIFDSESETEPGLMEQGIAIAADYLASWYAIMPGANSGDRLLTELQGIETFSDYVQALAYIRSLDIISSANLLTIKDNRVLLELSVEGDLQSLLDALALDRKLIPVANPQVIVDTLADLSAADSLRLSWMP